MIKEILISGFGGQGVMMMGQLITYAGMLSGKQVSWMPSYGPEMRGGTAYCSVIISDQPIGAPIVTEPDVLVAMNKPSLIKFEGNVKNDGIVLFNSSIIDVEPKRSDLAVFKVPANELAREIGNDKTANMIMVGAVIAASRAVDETAVEQALIKVFSKKPKLIDINKLALEKGRQMIGQVAAEGLWPKGSA
ncbi:MAG: 2-oxoacid:acceptor oxidoreductase family protein [Negativicutes bacterium]|nr:2-oxoacid:acceptor oxidoreductase family protein [Negativicutes bacterium]